MGKAFFYIVAAVYPLVVFLVLAVLKMPLRQVSLFVVLLSAVYILGAGSKKKSPVSRF